MQEQGLSEGARAAASSRGLILASRRQQLLAGLRHALVLRRSAPAPVLSWLGSLRVHGGPASIIARLRRQSRHDGSGIDQKLGGGEEVKLFRGGASWGRRGVLCFSASEDSMRCISYTGPGHVEGFSGQAKDRSSPRGVPHPHSYPTPNCASAVLPTSSHGPVVLDCSHP